MRRAIEKGFSIPYIYDRFKLLTVGGFQAVFRQLVNHLLISAFFRHHILEFSSFATYMNIHMNEIPYV